MADKIKLRRDTQANWEAVNPILDEGELGVILDSNGLVIGDGVTEFAKLPQKRSFSKSITITVGPGGDFNDVNEALAYIQYLQPKFGGESVPQIYLVFKQGYVFTHRIMFDSIYAPWLNIRQENPDVPLEINIPSSDSDQYAIMLVRSQLGFISLNMKNVNLTDLKTSGLYMQHSTIPALNLEIQDVYMGIRIDDHSVIQGIQKFVANRIKLYALYLAYDSYAMVRISSAFNINDVGITYPKDPIASAICITESKLILYNKDPSVIHYINNVNNAFSLRGMSQLFFRPNTTFNIDNVSGAVFYTWVVNSGSVSIYTPLQLGPNINAMYEPIEIVPNAYNKWMLISYN